MTKKRFIIVCILGVVVAVFLLRYINRHSAPDVVSAAPTRVAANQAGEQPPTMADVLNMALAARQHMSEHLHDYTARFTKRETDKYGELGEESEMQVKIQTSFRTADNQAPRRVYLRFEAPQSIKGREVIWGEDLYDGKMAVHEVGMILGLKTHWLDPNGMIAMAGQRYPISEIGMVRLVEKLIERGEKDRDNPDVRVTLSVDESLPGVRTELIQVRRLKPMGDEDDFSLAEIVIDRERQLILQYRSFGWPETDGGTPPLIESYTYRDVKTNVGLTDSDFDHKNPAYGFPAL